MRRPGFTLIELLVVIAILVILMGLSGAAYFKLMSTQMRKNTHTLLVKLDTGAVKKQTQAVRDAARNDFAKPAGTTEAAWVDAKLAQHFPRTFQEAYNPPAGLPSLYASELQQFGITATTTASPEQQAAILLWMALKRGYGGGTPLTAQDVGGLGSWTPPPPGGKPVEFLQDSFDRPITFTRSAATNPGFNPNGVKFVLAASGTDGVFDMDMVTFVPTAGSSRNADNIYSTQP